jgi:hypothetical protein
LLQMLQEAHLKDPRLDFAREQKYICPLTSSSVSGCPQCLQTFQREFV